MAKRKSFLWWLIGTNTPAQRRKKRAEKARDRRRNARLGANRRAIRRRRARKNRQRRKARQRR